LNSRWILFKFSHRLSFSDVLIVKIAPPTTLRVVPPPHKWGGPKIRYPNLPRAIASGCEAEG